MRDLARRFGRELQCHRATVNRAINPATSMLQALGMFSREERRALMTWLTRRGPFWEDVPVHDPNEWFECNGEIVTDTALAEAAYCSSIGIDRRVVSLMPSQWNDSRINVVWRFALGSTEIEVDNYWEPSALEAGLQQADPPVASWGELEIAARRRFQRLFFAADSFRYLDGQPFVPGAAIRILSRLGVLDRLMGLVDGFGHRTTQGQRLYEDNFTGDRAGFSDSSDTEKREFSRELTFRHPVIDDESLFCTWHGKVNHPPFRIHFSWPTPPGGELYVVYIGLKITRR